MINQSRVIQTVEDVIGKNTLKRAETIKTKIEDKKKKKDAFESLVKGNFDVKPTKLIGVGITGRIGNPLKPTIKELPSDVKQLAELVKVSATYDKKGLEFAKNRMRTNSPDYTLDTELSTPDYIVAVKNGKVTIAFRGTNPTRLIRSGFGKNLPEPVMWGFILKGGKEDIFEQHQLDKILRKITSKYSIDQIEHIAGYSMGGTKAHRFADLIGKDSTLFNPLLGKRFYDKAKSPDVKHRIYRTTDDIATASGLIQQKAMPSNVEVESIDPVKKFQLDPKKVKAGRSTREIIGLVDNHNLEHFVQEGDRTNGIRETQDVIDKRVNKFNEDIRGKSAEQVRALQEEMITELAPYQKVLSQELEIKATPFHRAVKSLGVSGTSIGIGVLGSFAGAKAVEELQKIADVQLDPYTSSFVGGTAGAYATEKMMQVLTKAPVSFARSIASGGVGALAQEATAEGLKAALKSTGMNEEVADVVAETSGGAVGGGLSVAAPTILSNASRMTAQALARSAAVATAEVGTEMATLAATEVAAEAATIGATEVAAEAVGIGALEAGAELAGVEIGTSIMPGLGTLIGAGIGALVAGGFAIHHALQPKHDYMLAPFRNQRLDQIIGYNTEITHILNDFNNKADFSDSKVEETETKINEIVRDIANREGWTRGYDDYKANLQQVQRGVAGHYTKNGYNPVTPHDTGYVLRGNYSAIEQQESEQHQRAMEQSRERARQYNTRRNQMLRQETEIPNWLASVLSQDEKYNYYQNVNLKNERIREIFAEQAGEFDVPRGKDTRRYFQSIIYQDTPEVPQFDAEGNLYFAKISEPRINHRNVSSYVPASVPASVVPSQRASIKDFHKIADVSARGSHVLNTIGTDQYVQKLIRGGDIHGVNKRIRDIFVENQDRSHIFADTVVNGGAELPQFTSTGELKYQSMNEPPPTTAEQG